MGHSGRYTERRHVQVQMRDDENLNKDVNNRNEQKSEELERQPSLMDSWMWNLGMS